MTEALTAAAAIGGGNLVTLAARDLTHTARRARRRTTRLTSGRWW